MSVALRRISGSPVLVHLLLVLGACLMVGPFVWMILTSLKTLGEATMVPPVVFPSNWQWNNYRDVWLTLPFADFYTNTVLMTAGRTVGQVVFCSMAAYAFARIQFPGRDFLFIVFLSVLMVPAQVFLIPQYLIMARLGWVNTLQALIVPGIFSAFGTFLLRQFFMSMPAELEEAAKLDGANHFQIYSRVMLPLAKSGLIALAIITIRWSWNDLLWPLIVINSPTKMVLSAGIASLQGQYLTHYPILMAGAALATWPLILMFFLFQRHFVEGIALSGSKG